MVLITQKEVKEIKEMLPYFDERDEELIKKLINSYEHFRRICSEERKQKIKIKEGKK